MLRLYLIVGWSSLASLLVATVGWAFLITLSAIWSDLHNSLALSKLIGVLAFTTFCLHLFSLQLFTSRLERRLRYAAAILKSQSPTLIGLALVALIWMLKQKVKR